MKCEQILKVFPYRSRFYGNRSYCYKCLKQYREALADAERAIELDPDWPKGHFRQGSALMGMKVSRISLCNRKLHPSEWRALILLECFSGTVRRSGPWSRC